MRTFVRIWGYSLAISSMERPEIFALISSSNSSLLNSPSLFSKK